MTVRVLAAVFLLASWVSQVSATEVSDGSSLLAEADKLAEAANWERARPLYESAERIFRAQSDRRRELYAKFGRLRRDMETSSYSEAATELNRDLADPILNTDPELKLRGLSVKGIVDLNLNTAAARDDYLQMLVVAKQLGDRKWENRANGELGIVAGLSGDTGNAGVALYKAIQTASAIHDTQAQVTFTTWLANGLTVNGMPERALPLLEHALSLIQEMPLAGFPSQLYIAKIRALLLLPNDSRGTSRQEARALISRALVRAQVQSILGAQTELLNQRGLIELEDQKLKAAESDFSQSATIAERANLPRMKMEAFFHLCQAYEKESEYGAALKAINQTLAEV